MTARRRGRSPGSSAAIGRLPAWGLAAMCVASLGCPNSTSRRADAAPQAAPDPLEGGELIFDGGDKKGWTESGSAVRETGASGPAKVHFGAGGDWVLSHPGLAGSFSALLFHVREPAGEAEFLAVSLGSADGHVFPAVKVRADQTVELGDGWSQITVPMAELNPKGEPFDRVVFRPFRPVQLDAVEFDHVGLASGAAPVQVRTPPSPAAPAGQAATGGRGARVHVQCEARSTKISPLIYGIAFGDEGWSTLGVTTRRWGGNPSTRYNWEGHFSNRANDWFFENSTNEHYDNFLADSVAHKVESALTVPMIGWVAKDATSYSFPVSVFGPQQKVDPYHPDVGNGVSQSGSNLTPGPQTRTSIPAPPEMMKRWVEAIRANDAKTGKRSVYEYILDNEPMLWPSTHRDVHPDPVSYDELLDRTVQYASVIRAADPDAKIAGPAEWGWSGYFWSDVDLQGHPASHADRKAHGDVPLVEWYLRKLREHEQKTGVRLLDVLDLHYYPQANNVYGSAADHSTQLLRLRSTRSLWDETYVDESWIKEPIKLLPRMKDWVDKNYPGRGLQIGEWNFGGERDITGALATAEALGRFAQFGVTAAYYWLAPPLGSPTALGFLTYRNFDGKGGHFLDQYVPTSKVDGASFFASRDADGKHLVIVAINMQDQSPIAADLDLGMCGQVATSRAYLYSNGASAFAASDPTPGTGASVQRTLPPWSITVFDVTLR